MSGKKNTIAQDSHVRMHFSLSLRDGTEAASTFDNEPLEFTLGGGSLAEGLENILLGLKTDTEETFTVDGNLVYGEREEGNIHSIALTRFPVGIDPTPGLIVGFNAADGTEIPGAILSVNETEAQVDFNHPLAGRELLFRVKILAVSP